MLKIMNHFVLFIFFFISELNLFANITAKEELTNIYDSYRQYPTNLVEHQPVLRQLAKECTSVVELGRGSAGSTWALLTGLSESSAPSRSFLEIEANQPSLEKLYLSKRLAYENGIDFRFIKANDITIKLERPVDMIFIDTIHTYSHLTCELENFSPMVNKYIVIHNTSPPWGYRNDPEYKGDYSEYPSSISRTKEGLNTAVNDFLKKNPGWILVERRFNNFGLITLTRAEKNGDE